MSLADECWNSLPSSLDSRVTLTNVFSTAYGLEIATYRLVVTSDVEERFADISLQLFAYAELAGIALDFPARRIEIFKDTRTSPPILQVFIRESLKALGHSYRRLQGRSDEKGKHLIFPSSFFVAGGGFLC
jgi:hypothetical protein